MTPSSMRFSKNEVVLLPIPFTDLTSRKVRPAIVIGFGNYPGDLFLVPLTSQHAGADFTLADWQAAGLNVSSGIEAQIATVESSLVLKIVGRLTDRDRMTLDVHLRQWLRL